MYACTLMGPHTTPEQEEAKCRDLISTVTRSVEEIEKYPDFPSPGTTEWAETVYVYNKLTGKWPATGC